MARNAKNTRMCSGCMARRDKGELVSIYKTDKGIEIGGSLPRISGRSVYLCKDGDCLAKAIKKKSIPRGLRCEIEPELYNKLNEYFKTLDGE